MSTSGSHAEPVRIDEPTTVPEFSDALSRVAAEGRPLIVQRNGHDLAAVVSVEQLELLQDAEARRHAEWIASQINWKEYVGSHPPPQSWLEGDEPKPF